MSLERLGIEAFRCIERADLELDRRCNLISGANASGKTSLLEAIFFMGRGRSFRSARPEPLVRDGCEAFTLTGRVGQSGQSQPLGLRVGADGIVARFGGRPVAGLAELATVFPVQAIDPEVHRLVGGGAQERRRYLDWGVFHVEPSFVEHWRRYQRALRQRNAALRTHQSLAAIRAWEPELTEAGELVNEYRLRYVAQLEPIVADAGAALLGRPIELTLQRGWSGDRSLEDAVEGTRERDRGRGLTHVGPHRAELVVRLGGSLARDRVSRGQQKLVAAAMLIGQLRCDAGLGSPVAALLVDDPAAELDAANFERLLAEVLGLPAQLFLTALDTENPAFERLPPGRRFHVEQGAVTRLV